MTQESQTCGQTETLLLKGMVDKDIDTIVVKGTAERETIVAKLNELGYPEKGDNTLLRQAKSYVNCAIGRMSETK